MYLMRPISLIPGARTTLLSLMRERPNTAPLQGRTRTATRWPSTENDRKKYWATTFRALGDVVHLVQDMAQPQHTRNDPHAGSQFDGSGASDPILGHKSVYEAYIDARARNEVFTTLGGVDPVTTPYITVQPVPLTYDGYPVIPDFSEFLGFYTTRGTDTKDIFARRGMADYSNRGFFSAGTNLGNNNYGYPLQFAQFIRVFALRKQGLGGTAVVASILK